MTDTDILRQQLLELVDGRGAHMPFDAAVADFPAEAINRRPPNVPYTPWHLLEHIRIAQWDILDYMRNAPTSPRTGPRSTGRLATPRRRPSSSRRR